MSQQRYPMYPNPAPFFDPDGGMPCANIFHRDHPGMVVLEIRGDFAVEYAREIIARGEAPSSSDVDALALKAEAINDIADVLGLPTGSTAKDAVEGVRRLAADVPKMLGMLAGLTMERDAARTEGAAHADYSARIFEASEAMERERDAALAQVPKWAAAIDHAPEDCADVLAVWWQGEQCIAHRRKGTWWYRGNFGMKEANVPPTHWMPLPAGPKP